MTLTFTPEFLAKYEMHEQLGEGGMGTVHRGIQRSLERPVAIKFLSRQLLDAEFLARFQVEAKLAAQVFHSNLVAVIEAGDMAGMPFIVFELVEGCSLREHLRRAGGRLSVREALEVIRQAAAGLAEAHRIGIVHRDIKPENILVSPKGVKVADFGLAKGSAAASQKTRSGVILGTPAYMSPEQAQERAITPASDTFSLGVVLYELMSGEQPFRGTSTLDLLSAIVNQQPAHLPAEVPHAVGLLVTAMLAKDPAGRPAPMGEVATQLATLAAQASDTPLSGAVHGNGRGQVSGAASNATRPVRSRRTSLPTSPASSPRNARGPFAAPAVVPAAAPARTARVIVLSSIVTLALCAVAARAWLGNGAPAPAVAVSAASPLPAAVPGPASAALPAAPESEPDGAPGTASESAPAISDPMAPPQLAPGPRARRAARRTWQQFQRNLSSAADVPDVPPDRTRPPGMRAPPKRGRPGR